MIGALALSSAVLTLASLFGAPAPLEAQLQALAALAAVLGLWLGLGIGRVAAIRFFSAADFDAATGGAPSPTLTRAQAMLANTAEQALLSALAGLAAALTSDRTVLVLAAMAGLFTAGRVLFWAGYARGAEARAFGFALTFYPSLLVLIGSVVSLVV